MDAPVAPPVFHQHRYAQELDRRVEPGCSWLDIGAGHCIHSGWEGPSCAELARRPAYFAGCDVGDDVLRHPHLHDARTADAADLPWDDARFEIVTANMVVEHVPDPGAVFREVFRVLKPGGAFVFLTPNLNHPVIRVAATLVPPSIRTWYGVVVERRAAEDVFPTRYRCNTVGAVTRVARATGFVPEMVEPFLSTYPILPGLLGRAENRFVRMAVRTAWGREMGADLLVVLRKPRLARAAAGEGAEPVRRGHRLRSTGTGAGADG